MSPARIVAGLAVAILALAPKRADCQEPGAVPDEESTDRTQTNEPSGPNPKKKKPKARCRAWARPEYVQMARRWFKIPEIPAPKFRNGFRDLSIYSVNLGERVRVFPFLDDGTLDPAAMAEIERIFRDKDTDSTHSLEPRLVKLLYKTAVHFEARQITLISGYREPVEPEGGGNHAKGRAADFVIPGVSLHGLASYLRRLGHVGVGLYPTSRFIHLDVRDGPSFFWIDPSGPGQKSCLFRVMAGLGAMFDRRWRPEKDEPVPARDRKGRLRGAMPPDGTPPAARLES